MGLDAQAVFFYGMNINASDILKLRERDALSVAPWCPSCAKDAQGRYCSDCGAETKPAAAANAPGFGFKMLEALGRTPEPLQLLVMDYEDLDTYFLVVKDSVVTAGDLNEGSSATRIPAMSHEANAIKARCAAFDIAFMGCSCFVGLSVSY